MKNSLYIIPNLKKVSGGPRTRISLFREIFKKNNNFIIEKNDKLSKCLRLPKVDTVYVESATNRIAFIDIICLFLLRLRAKKVIVFIRDIYIELFPKEYRSARGKITLYSNRLSNFYLTLISTSMVFPTIEMGRVFFEKNNYFPKRKFADLPPGTYDITINKELPDFSKKIGILYLGSTAYVNSGFNNFKEFAKVYQDKYNFYVLSGDKNLSEKIKSLPIRVSKVPRAEIPTFIQEKNIGYAFHTRPRNKYDDLTFPIKVFDFVSFQLPFFTEKHKPLLPLLGNDYPLFATFEDMEAIYHKIEQTREETYKNYIDILKKTALENTYDKRYQKVLES